MNLLEKLYATRATLRGEHYDFNKWSYCTCGHIYTQAHGTVGDNQTDIRTSRNATYKDMLRAVLEANIPRRYFTRRRIGTETAVLTVRVSDLTSQIARTKNCTRREAAITMLDNAIDMVEKREAKAMIDVAKMAEDATAHEFPLGGD